MAGKVFYVTKPNGSEGIRAKRMNLGQDYLLGYEHEVQIIHKPESSSVSLRGTALNVHKLIYEKLLRFNQNIWKECWSNRQDHERLDYMLIMTNNLHDASESLMKGSSPKDEVCIEGLEDLPWMTTN